MNPPAQQTTDRVAALTLIWQKVLGNPDLDEDSDLFDNRGSSLHVLQITALIYDVLGLDVKLRHVFSHTSPRRLADFLDSEPGYGESDIDATNP